MASKVAFVAGATGYTGREVVRIAAQAGHRVVAHVRPDSSRQEEWKARFEAVGAEVDTTPWDEEAMVETLRALGPEAVFALLGTTRSRARGEGQTALEAYEKVDYGLTALLRRAAEGCGHAPRFVYLSALGVTPETKNAYLKVRARIEAELRQGTLPFTVLRPAFITGDDRDDGRTGERVQAAALDGVGRVLSAVGARRWGRRLQTTSNTALARDLVNMAFDPAFDGRIIESEELSKR